MRSIVRFALCFLFLGSSLAKAGALELRLGPPEVGIGGSNPVSIPPVSPAEYEVSYVTDGGFESNFAVTPGLLFGERAPIDCFYASLGGGIVIDANGQGLGAYMGFGYTSGKPKDSGFHFNADFKQALGYGQGGWLSPSALRLGVSYKY